jgi:DNA polymerase elongation subunit (family B)
MRILLLDIETSPNTAYVWSIWQENIPLARLIDSSKVLCWTAKWFGEEHVMFDSIHKSREKAMLKRVHKLMNDADAVVTYNGNKFDLPVLNKEFFLNRMGPPAPYKSIDLYRTTKSKFKFVSNKLDYISQQLGLGSKIETDFSLWVKCMEKDDEAWAKMEEYNTNDVILLERLYEEILPWITTHPNHSVYTGTLVCPRCGGNHYQRRGFAISAAGKYHRLHCQDCGHWFREGKMIKQELTEKFMSL